MKSSVSFISDSIENQSLPSIPVHREVEEKKESQSTLKTSKFSNSIYNYRAPTPVNSRLNSKILSHLKSFPNTSIAKQSKTPELNKINECAILKVFEHRDFGNSPSNYSRMSEDFSLLNLPKSRSYVQNRPRFLMPSIRSNCYRMDSCSEGKPMKNNKDKCCVYLSKLQPSEAEFLGLVTENSVKRVEKYLNDHPSLNINCINFQGISALHIAVRNRSEEMVEFLLRYPHTEIGDTVLHAVRDNCIKILVILLEAQKKVSPGLEFAGATHSTIFPAHVTPIILAAQLNNYEIVNLLISRGHTIIRPHSPICDCISCKTCVVNDDGLHASSARLSVYRAISAPAYLVHITADPILEAFYLTEELAANASSYRHLASEYLQLRDDVRDFTVGLIGNCRTSSEVELILKQTLGCEGRRQFILPRLLLAVTCKQWEFVAHPNTQQVLESYWLGDWYSWRRKSFLAKVLIVLCRIFILPIILLFSMVLPRHRLLKHYQIPLNKLITHVASYFVFLSIVFLISNQDKSKLQRGPPQTGAEALLILYVCGYTWSAIRMCMMQGPRRFFTAMWNWAEIIMLSLFWLTFVFWTMAAVDAEAGDDIYKTGTLWFCIHVHHVHKKTYSRHFVTPHIITPLLGSCLFIAVFLLASVTTWMTGGYATILIVNNLNGTQILEPIRSDSTSRRNILPSDNLRVLPTDVLVPTQLPFRAITGCCHTLFGACEQIFYLRVYASIRNMPFHQFHHSVKLKPEVSLGKMTIDIYKYIIVFAIIICSFAAGLARFYQYYDGMVYEDKFGMKTVQVSSFTSLADTLNTLFWALFCMAPLESADIVLENTRGSKQRHTNVNRHGYTERIGYFCFGCFEVISVIVVLNMLIATMSNTFQRVTDNVAIEWTFVKTEVYIEYMWQTTLPSPLNLIPTTTGLANLIDWFRAKMCKTSGARARCSLSHCCFIERDIEAHIQKDFPSLMSVLVQRYFTNSNNSKSCSGELQTMREDITSIKYVLHNKTE